MGFGNVLVAGAGPAAIKIISDISKEINGRISIVNRSGERSRLMKQACEKHGYIVTSKMVGSNVQPHLKSVVRTKISGYYEGWQELRDIWDTLVICTPSDGYIRVVQEMIKQGLYKIKQIVLVSPGLGSSLLVNSLLREAGLSVEVISLSSYYAATKWETADGLNLTSITKAVKRKIYAGSSYVQSKFLELVQTWLNELGVECRPVSSPLAAESRSITTYVHPPLFMNDFSLGQILSLKPSSKSMYKLYPEGPISQHSIRAMLCLWKEISALVTSLSVAPVNLLKFLNDDNYPVHEFSISREEIEQFCSLSTDRQEYLLYIRYSSILIDPFSTPDQHGKYFDFSAVPYPQIQITSAQGGKWKIPRIPLEDYKRLKLICRLAETAGIPMPQGQQLIGNFERRLAEFVHETGENRFDDELYSDDTANDAKTIWEEFRRISDRILKH